MSARVEFPVHHNSVTVRISEEMAAMRYGHSQRGHMEPVTPSPEDLALHARAVDLVAELEANPYVEIGGYDADVSVRPLETERWVPDETHDEWMKRWRAHRAANPDEKPPQDFLDRLLLDTLTNLIEPSPVAETLAGKKKGQDQ